MHGAPAAEVDFTHREGTQGRTGDE